MQSIEVLKFLGVGWMAVGIFTLAFGLFWDTVVKRREVVGFVDGLMIVSLWPFIYYGVWRMWKNGELE